MKSQTPNKQKFFLFFLAAIILNAFFFVNIKKNNPATPDLIVALPNQTNGAVEKTTTATPPVAVPAVVTVKPATATPTVTAEKIYLTGVPFVVQAPFGEWQDPRQQDACEEMAAFLAVSWARGTTTISRQTAKEKILDMVKYQEENFGESRDTSAQDTIDRLYFGYLSYQKVRLVENITSADIIRELTQGNLIVVPANGQLLKNIHFTQPGPERHMIIIRGFDPVAEKFITNDVGFGTGENYLYPVKLLFEAMADYPSGYHVPRVGLAKVMIVIEPDF